MPKFPHRKCDGAAFEHGQRVALAMYREQLRSVARDIAALPETDRLDALHAEATEAMADWSNVLPVLVASSHVEAIDDLGLPCIKGRHAWEVLATIAHAAYVADLAEIVDEMADAGG